MPAAANAPSPAPAPAARPAANSNSRLAKVVKGRMRVPFRLFAYGPEGVGKSTLAAHAPDPIWFDIEDGTAQLDVARYRFRDEEGGHIPLSYEEITAGLDDLLTNDHAFKTVVMDTADRLEALIWRFICKRDSKPGKPLNSIEDYGYNKGPGIALDEWRALCARLDRLRMHRRMNAIVLGQMKVTNFKNPEGDDYDRYTPRVDPKAAGWLREWSDATAFCCFEEGAGKLTEKDRPKGFSTGMRLMKLARTAAYDAKSRYATPAEVKVELANPWAPFAAAMEDAMSLDVGALERLITAEVERIDDTDLGAKVKAAVAAEVKRGNADALHRFLNDLKQRQAKAAG